MVEKVDESISSLNKGVAFKVDEEMLGILRRLAVQTSNGGILAAKV
jgi:flagellar protein FlaG